MTNWEGDDKDDDLPWLEIIVLVVIALLILEILGDLFVWGS